jgi:hypothetical protein
MASEVREFDDRDRPSAQAWHAGVLVSGTVYHEVAPQLVLMGFLQRLVNGGGQVSREYAP